MAEDNGLSVAPVLGFHGLNVFGRLTILYNFRQEPRAPLSLIDPNFEQTRRRDIVVVIAHLVSGPQTSRQLLIVVAQLGEHLERCHRFLVVIFQSLVFADIADRPDRRAADFARAFRDRIGHGKDLGRLFVEQQMVIAKVTTTDVPVKILRFYVEREHVRKQLTQVACELLHCISA